MRKDYRARVTVIFDIDFNHDSNSDRETLTAVAERITKTVFANSFGRAECVSVLVRGVEPLHLETK